MKKENLAFVFKENFFPQLVNIFSKLLFFNINI